MRDVFDTKKLINPEVKTGYMLLCGIEEAGRGPVIGPLVMCGVLIKEEDEPKLKKLGVKDSKLLTPRKREALYDQIIKIALKYKLIVVPAQEIDDALNSDDLNLNWLEAQKSAEIINYLKPDKVIIDSPSNNCKAYKEYVRNILYKPIEMAVEHKADVNYPVVSAASILAKVTRDREMEKIQQKYGNCGPGYMSNSITQKFLEENWEKHPEIFRKTWISYKKLAQAKNQKSLGEF